MQLGFEAKKKTPRNNGSSPVIFRPLPVYWPWQVFRKKMKQKTEFASVNFTFSEKLAFSGFGAYELNMYTGKR